MPDRNTITSLIAFCFSHASAILLPFRSSRHLDQPGGPLLDDGQDLGAECATIRSAIIGPIPLIRPEPR